MTQFETLAHKLETVYRCTVTTPNWSNSNWSNGQHASVLTQLVSLFERYPILHSATVPLSRIDFISTWSRQTMRNFGSDFAPPGISLNEAMSNLGGSSMFGNRTIDMRPNPDPWAPNRMALMLNDWNVPRDANGRVANPAPDPHWSLANTIPTLVWHEGTHCITYAIVAREIRPGLSFGTPADEVFCIKLCKRFGFTLSDMRGVSDYAATTPMAPHVELVGELGALVFSHQQDCPFPNEDMCSRAHQLIASLSDTSQYPR